MTHTRTSAHRACSADGFWRIACLITLLAGMLIVVTPLIAPAARRQSLSEIRRAIVEDQPAVEQLLNEHLRTYPTDPESLVLAAEVAARASKHELSIEYFRKLPEDGGQWQLQRELGIARRCRVLGRMSDEERHLRNVLRLNPTHGDANHRLGHLLQIQGRTWESAAHFLMQIQRGKCRGDELLGVATTERFFRADSDFDQRAIASNSQQPGVALLGTARRHLFENRNADAERLLRQIVATAPGLGEAQGRLGRIIVERGDFDEFLRWRGSLPRAAREHPEVWFVQGLQARRIGQTEGAVHCFVRALRLSPNHLPANVQIAACLELVGKSDAAQTFKRRAEQLSELEGILNLLRAEVDEAIMRKAADRLGALGRYWEAAGWLYVMDRLGFPDDPARPHSWSWGRLAVQDPHQNAGFLQELAALQIDQFEEPNWGLSASPATGSTLPESVEERPPVSWDLTDDAAVAGIQFSYFEGTTEETRLQHIFNVVGGGVAAFDFELDGWPDLHIAQANDWRVDDSPRKFLDSLYRNRQGQYFQDVAAVANLVEAGFSHGVCAGDFDQDGFPDVYVSNLGPNRLFHNNGDGTFQDVTESAGTSGREWSVTSVMADFNGDTLPDLYVGNYSLREETALKECHTSTGELMACTPDLLNPESDVLYLNLGDGRFRDITDVSGTRETSGRALALIAWDFTGTGRTSLFVANDTSANFLWNNLETDAAGIPHFAEEGVLRGLAFDADGNAQASMGVASGDVNGDGMLDLFVTNFQNESNTFYSEGPDGLFLDFTRQFGLRDSGYRMLGFGTQFADIDTDGWDDLIITNGHVDKSRDSAETDRMRPQLFRNEKGVSFSEVPADALGAYFNKTYLGRGLATTDWNKDGRVDFAVSNLHAPFSLVTNHTASTGRGLAVRLIATSGVRDGCGARIRARIGGRDQFRLAVAGDGYLTTNEHVYLFSIPEGERIEDLAVTWSNGKVQTCAVAAVGGEVLIVEGSSAARVLSDVTAEGSNDLQ